MQFYTWLCVHEYFNIYIYIIYYIIYKVTRGNVNNGVM